VPDAVAELVRYYRQEGAPGEAFAQFVDRVGVPALRERLGRHAGAPEERAGYDWDQEERFSLAGLGQGECAG
jgi:hypothetical protein